MTDNEIIKALECCSVAYDCPNCPFECDCGNKGNLSTAAIDLINRPKTEIERLQITSSFCHKSLTDAWKRIEEIDKLNETAKSKAIKAFIEKVNRRLNSIAPRGAYLYNIMRECEKEMVGDDNAVQRP